MGMMSGSKGLGHDAVGSPIVESLSPTPAPTTYNYPVDTTAADAEKVKAQKALLAMKGRQSTILTGDTTLGEPSLGKRTLLGA
jgi:hypothetical protein